jgi:hypothetical protein
LDPEQRKMLTLTTKGSAARWKLVKTLRDKKAETASGAATTATTSPTNNEAVRETFPVRVVLLPLKSKTKKKPWALAISPLERNVTVTPNTE